MTPRPSLPPFDPALHSEAALEMIATVALQSHTDVLPSEPAAIVVERLIEEAFGFNETYEELEAGVLGEIRFGADDRPIGICITRRLAVIDPNDPAIDHERRATLAHEFGHGLVHGTVLGEKVRRQRAPGLPGLDVGPNLIVCRDVDVDAACPRPVAAAATERWLEWEANYLMGALLMPRNLLLQSVASYMTGVMDGISPRHLPDDRRQIAVAGAAKQFNVSLSFAASRLASIVPHSAHPDLFCREEKVGPPRQTTPSKRPVASRVNDVRKISVWSK